jgi:hypothetical protein
VPPKELVDSERAELEASEEQRRVREFGARLTELERERDALREEEWRRDRIPVGIIWRDPRDMQGWGGYTLDPEEQELLRVIQEHRAGRRSG